TEARLSGLPEPRTHAPHGNASSERLSETIRPAPRLAKKGLAPSFQIFSCQRGGSMSRRNAAFSHRLGLESLEGRQMMAGNVLVSVSGGDLVVTGDNAGNVVG